MSIDDVLGILRISLTDDMDNKYFKYLTKTIDYGIEFVEPIKILLIPEIIYVHTKQDKNTLLSKLLKAITDEYNGKKISNSKNDSIGHIIGTTDDLEVFSVSAFASLKSHTIDINVSGQKHYFIMIIDEYIDSVNSVCVEID